MQREATSQVLVVLVVETSLKHPHVYPREDVPQAHPVAHPMLAGQVAAANLSLLYVHPPEAVARTYLMALWVNADHG